jgi:UDP-N-acetylmuramate--alanine ligase
VKIYCSGIGGIGLSAYASLQKHAGHEVLGSDRADSALLDDLRSQGIAIFLDQTGASVPSDADVFVYSEAIPESAPERMIAKEYGIKQMSYPQAIGELSKGSTLISICGTHGKSSTTAMAARLLMQAGKDPTVVVGTKMKELDGKNWRKGSGDLFVLESCEYRRSFHNYSPKIILLTNCDGDHFDYYTGKEDYQEAFMEFIDKLPEDGLLITHMSDPDCRAVAEMAGKRTIDADVFPLLDLATPGRHMQENAQLVLALAQVLEIPQTEAEKVVSGYSGSWRRMEEKGMYKGSVQVIDDYGHHPREIRATIEALRSKFPERRIVCAFQPHTHDRTLKLYNDFTTAFSGLDIVVVTNVYDRKTVPWCV